MKLVIVGASGYLGSALYQQLARNHQVLGTYCSCPIPGMIRYDIAQDDPASLPVDWSTIDSIVLASGVTRIEECARNGDHAREINVTAASRFFDFAAARKLHVAFLSTDYVYDGAPSASGKPRLFSEHDPLAPTTQHGLQRVEAEQSLQQAVREHLILRLSMNVTMTRRLGFPFSSWVDALLRGEVLRLATDLVHCVTWVYDTTQAIENALQQKATGIYNLSAPEFFSRYEWGRKVCESIGANSTLVQPCAAADLGFSEARPRDLSLDTDLFQKTVGHEFASTDELMQVLKKMY